MISPVSTYIVHSGKRVGEKLEIGDDGPWVKRLQSHLSALCNEEKISLKGVLTWEEFLAQELGSSGLVLICVSADLLAEDESSRVDQKAIDLRSRGFIVIPILLRPGSFVEYSPLGTF